MAVSALAVAMIELSFGASLVPLIGAAALPPPGFGAAGFAAVALSPVAVPTDPEDSVAADNRTNTLTKDHLAMKIHVRPSTGLDNGDQSWQVRTSSMCGYLLKVARLSARTASTVRVPRCVPRLRRRTLSVARLMIDR
jgi:hypothetical protein